VNVLVTGGAGYIGSVVATMLVEAGHKVTVVDNLTKGHEDALPDKVRFIQADIADIGKLLTNEGKIDAVLHFAAYIAAGESVKMPEVYWQNNTVQTLGMLNALRQLGIKKLIFSSTAAVYGNSDMTPIPENAATVPTNPYGMTKLAIDMAITSECMAHDLSATSFRYFNVAGAYKSRGERHDPETHLIPNALAAAAGKLPNIKLYGDDYPTPDGTCIRDYIHVADLARAHLLALDALTPGTHSIYNLGNGKGFSNKEVLTAVEKVTGKTLTINIAPRREGDPAVLIASSEKAKRELGWVPQIPGLEDIIRDAWKFYTQYSK
jgi:UDP-glucose 4-epimerase